MDEQAVRVGLVLSDGTGVRVSSENPSNNLVAVKVKEEVFEWAKTIEPRATRTLCEIITPHFGEIPFGHLKLLFSRTMCI